MLGHHPTDDPAPRIRVEPVDHLTQDRLVARLEMPHDTVIAIVDAGLPPELLKQLESVLQEAVDSGTWVRQPLPPQRRQSEGDLPEGVVAA